MHPPAGVALFQQMSKQRPLRYASARRGRMHATRSRVVRHR